jgi:hypothetical protein
VHGNSARTRVAGVAPCGFMRFAAGAAASRIGSRGEIVVSVGIQSGCRVCPLPALWVDR